MKTMNENKEKLTFIAEFRDTQIIKMAEFLIEGLKRLEKKSVLATETTDKDKLLALHENFTSDTNKMIESLEYLNSTMSNIFGHYHEPLENCGEVKAYDSK